MKKVLFALIILSLCSLPAFAQRQHQGGSRPSGGARASQGAPRQQAAPRQAQPRQQQAQPRSQAQGRQQQGRSYAQPYNRGGQGTQSLQHQVRPYGPQFRFQYRSQYRSQWGTQYRTPYFYRFGPRIWWSDSNYSWYPYYGTDIYQDSYYDGAAHVKFDGVPDETVITVDGFARGQVGDVHGWGRDMNLTPGEHTITLQVPGQAPFEFRVQLSSGESVTLRLPE